ncbi:Uclacyanin 1 [Linum perenne]
MSISRLSIMIVLAMAMVNLSLAANYIVGGPNGGWDATTNLQTWAASQSFQTGDNLIFQFAPSHDVAEVTKSDYDACQAGTPIQSYSGGAAAVPLTSSGKRYFICGTPGHCSLGMKLEVNVLSTISPASSAAAAVAAPEQSQSPTPSPVDSLPIPSPEAAASSSLPFPTVESPAGFSPPALEIPVLGSSPALAPFPTGTSALTPPNVDSSSAGGIGFGRIQGLVAGFCWFVAVIMVMG